MITLLDYGAGNVRSVINAIESLGETVKIVAGGEDILAAEKLVFPGVGAFGNMMNILQDKKYFEPLRAYLHSNRPFLGICLGLQALFEDSEEAPDVSGLGLIAGSIKRFVIDLSVPHIGWNGLNFKQASRIYSGLNDTDDNRLRVRVCQQHSKGQYHRYPVSSGEKRSRRTRSFAKFPRNNRRTDPTGTINGNHDPV